MMEIKATLVLLVILSAIWISNAEKSDQLENKNTDDAVGYFRITYCLR